MKSNLTGALGMIAAAIFAIPCYAGINTWTPTGPNGGWTSMVYYVPGSGGVALATNNDGLYRTTNNGLAWQRVVGNLTNLDLRLITADPRNPSHLVFQGDQRGLYISDDAGATFRSVGAYPPLSINTAQTLAYANDGLVIYAGSGNKILRSTDGGNTWGTTTANLPSVPGQPLSVSDLAIDPIDPNTLYVSTYATGPGTAYKTTNGGQTWSTLTLAQVFTKFAIDPAATNIILAAAPYGGIQRSVNGGTSWVSVSVEPISLIQFDPHVPNRVFAISLSGKVMRSIDSGANWTTLVELKLFQPRSLSFDTTVAGRMLLGSAEGVMLSEDHGATWVARDSNLFGGQFGFSTHRASRTVYAFGDPGPVGVYARDSNGNWNSLGASTLRTTQPVDAAIRTLAIAPNDANTMYTARNFSILKSTNGGQIWAKPTNDLDNDAVWKIAIDPVTPSTLYVCTYPRAILRSTDSGVTWSARSNGIASNDARQIAIDPKTPTTLYATTTDRVLYKSIDAGLSWSALTVPTTATVFDKISIDPIDTATLYLATSDGVWRSENGGGTWTRIANTGGFVTEVTIDPDFPNVLVLNGASTAGIQRSVDKGASWELLPITAQSWLYGNVHLDPANLSNILWSVGFNGVSQFETSTDLEVTFMGALAAINRPIPSKIRLTNKGQYGASGVKIVADMPSGTQDVSVETDKGSCTRAQNHIECTHTGLKSNEVMTVTVTLTIASATGQLTASATGREADPNSSNNSVSAAVTPIPPTGNDVVSNDDGGGSLGATGLLLLAALRIWQRKLNGPSRAAN